MGQEITSHTLNDLTSGFDEPMIPKPARITDGSEEMNDSFYGTWNIKHPSHLVSLFLITLENFEGIKTKPITTVKHLNTIAAT